MKTLNRILRLFLFLPEEQEKFLSDKLEEINRSQIPENWRKTMEGFNNWQKEQRGK